MACCGMHTQSPAATDTPSEKVYGASAFRRQVTTSTLSWSKNESGQVAYRRRCMNVSRTLSKSYLVWAGYRLRWIAVRFLREGARRIRDEDKGLRLRMWSSTSSSAGDQERGGRIPYHGQLMYGAEPYRHYLA